MSTKPDGYKPNDEKKEKAFRQLDQFISKYGPQLRSIWLSNIRLDYLLRILKVAENLESLRVESLLDFKDGKTWDKVVIMMSLSVLSNTPLL